MIDSKKIARWVKSPNKPICRNGASPLDVQQLREVCMQAGMSSSLFYMRTNYIGFDQWEMLGFERCIRNFAETVIFADADPETRDTQKETISHLDFPHLCEFLVESGNLSKFYNFMQPQGMSYKTVCKRFRNRNFAQWEIVGVESILQQCKES